MFRLGDIIKRLPDTVFLQSGISSINQLFALTRVTLFLYSGLNVVFRKLASHAKPSMEIELEDGKVKIIAKAAFFTQTMVFPINEPYEQEYEGVKMKVC